MDSSTPQQKEEGPTEPARPDDSERTSVPTAGDGTVDEREFASRDVREGEEGGGVGERSTAAVAAELVTSEKKTDDLVAVPGQREPPSSSETESTRDSTGGGGESKEELGEVTPEETKDPASEEAPVVSASSSVEMGSPGHSDDVAHDDSPTQTNPPNLVERTDSMSSEALLLPREQ